MNNTFFINDRDREFLEYGLIIGNLITQHQARDSGSTSFTDGWACDYEMAEWAEKVIHEWVGGYDDGTGTSSIPENYFTEYVQKRLKEEQAGFSGKDGA